MNRRPRMDVESGKGNRVSDQKKNLLSDFRAL